ncbi:N-acetyl-beta-hexosaminidase [Tritrichomonas foetus]|uniref:beta-N-acetylhexosaminidase n=1 Tax=Tritrichomonas foetus TaxID=1144522 RepID=A0A1J4KK50_9EUKA|nr:N-acetyl-beta-hexosaminidase [Tritrichomonas foetus]|eukprot:OHT11679.1 N-acetyl-beta-hexosaminidase [Tritrichomonas foetus]
MNFLDSTIMNDSFILHHITDLDIRLLFFISHFFAEMGFLSLFSLFQNIPNISVHSGTNITKIIPEPYKIHYYKGRWHFPDELSICSTNNFQESSLALEYFANVVKDHFDREVATGKCHQSLSASRTNFIIAEDKTIPEEGYQISITQSSGVKISASSLSGFFYAAKTLDQIIDQDKTMQHMLIDDKPRFRYRGLMLDVCRHFFNTSTIMDVLTEMSHYKLNKFHWHLTEDQAWRIEIKKHPKLTEIGSIRKASPQNGDRHILDDEPYGPYFFTQEEIREIIEFAKKLHIQIIPEIEMPGHALAALSAYPQFSCTGGPFEPRCFWGVDPDVFCAGNDEAIKFLEEVLDEVVQLFDSPFIHIGGDECPKKRWHNCSKCQKRMKDFNLANEEELQSWFVKHFEKYLSQKGRRIIGWDEILQGGVAESAVVMSWHGTKLGLQAANAGHEVIMTPVSHCYFDFYQIPNDKYEYIGGLTTVNKVYSLNPTEGLPPDKEKFILGVQANLWTEHVRTRDEVMWKIFPRLLALSEVAWTANENKDWNIFYNKLKFAHIKKLKQNEIIAAPIDKVPIGHFHTRNQYAVRTFEYDATLTCPINSTYRVIVELTKGSANVYSVFIFDEENLVGMNETHFQLNERYQFEAYYEVNVTNKMKYHEMTLKCEFECLKESCDGNIYMDFYYENPEREKFYDLL